MSLIISAVQKLTDAELQRKQATMRTEQRLTAHTLLPLRQIRGVISAALLLPLRKKKPVLICVGGFLFTTFLNDY